MPDVTLYNTRSKQLEVFQPLRPGAVSLYSCGPTVYDHAHIGNLSAYIFADTLRRTLTLAGYHVTHVMNFTDVDDKTITHSQTEQPDEEPMAALKNLTRSYEQLFLSDIEKIGFDTTAVTFVRATEHIEAMQAIIRELYEAGFAYIADDGVYFSIQKYREAGHTYGQLVTITEQSTSQARISNDEYDKDNVHDFALWKRQKDNEPAWEFDFDSHAMLGRPGWHIECSAMSRANLGQPFDIHTGGVDNIFPHHENEIAQSTAASSKEYATFFVHSEHLLVDGKKMAKSAQNFFTLSDIIERSYDPLTFRLLVLQSHYRSQTNFSWDSLEAARNRLLSLEAMADMVFQPQTSGGVQAARLSEAKQAILTALTNDLNTPEALASLSRLEADISSQGIAQSCVEDFTSLLTWLDQAFGLRLGERSDITDNQQRVLHERAAARNDQDWARSDALRAELESMGIRVRDTASGQIWSRI